MNKFLLWVGLCKPYMIVKPKDTIFNIRWLSRIQYLVIWSQFLNLIFEISSNEGEFSIFSVIVSIGLIYLSRSNLRDMRNQKVRNRTSFHGILSMVHLNIYQAIFKGKQYTKFVEFLEMDQDPFNNGLLLKMTNDYLKEIYIFSSEKKFNSGVYMKIVLDMSTQKKEEIDLPF